MIKTRRDVTVTARTRNGVSAYPVAFDIPDGETATRVCVAGTDVPFYELDGHRASRSI
jgi:hypothetical protein